MHQVVAHFLGVDFLISLYPDNYHALYQGVRLWYGLSLRCSTRVMDFAQTLEGVIGEGGIYGVSKSTGSPPPPTTAYYWGAQDAGATTYLPLLTALLLFEEGVVLKSTIHCTSLLLLKACNFLYPAPRKYTRCTGSCLYTIP